jgi:hypothetical protein
VIFGIFVVAYISRTAEATFFFLISEISNMLKSNAGETFPLVLVAPEDSQLRTKMSGSIII